MHKPNWRIIGGLRARTIPWFFGHFWKCPHAKIQLLLIIIIHTSALQTFHSTKDPSHLSKEKHCVVLRVPQIDMYVLTQYTLTSISIFSIPFSIHLLGGNKDSTIKGSMLGNDFLYSHDLNEWFSSDIVRRNEMLVTLKPLTPKISLVILLTVCQMIPIQLVWRIGYRINQ